HQGQILPNVEPAVAGRSELADRVVLRDQVDVGSIGGDSHPIVVSLREAKDRARVKRRWIRYVSDGDAIHELHISRQSKVSGESDIQQKTSQVRVENVREHNRR